MCPSKIALYFCLFLSCFCRDYQHVLAAHGDEADFGCGDLACGGIIDFALRETCGMDPTSPEMITTIASRAAHRPEEL
eukprot:symbB.v1.2.036946.t1/scaffold5337.1/size28304/3